MDNVDRQILDALVEDSDGVRRVLARRVGLKESNLSKKIAALCEDGVIQRFSADIDYAKAGYHTHAFTLLRLKAPQAENLAVVLEKLAGIEEAIEVYTAFDDYDVYVRWLCKSNAELMGLLKIVLDATAVDHSETKTLGQNIRHARGPRLADPQKA